MPEAASVKGGEMKAYILCPGPQLKDLLPLVDLSDGITIAVNAAALYVPKYDWFCSTDIGCIELKPVSEHVERNLPRVGIITIWHMSHHPGLCQWCNENALRIETWDHEGQVGLNYKFKLMVTNPGQEPFETTGITRDGVYSLPCAIDTAARLVGAGGSVDIIGASMRGFVPGDWPYRWPVERSIVGHQMLRWRRRGVKIRRQWFGLKH